MAPKKSAHAEPDEGLCCLCTMEDITMEDDNYGTFCSCISKLIGVIPWKLSDLTHTIIIVEYQCYPSMEWKPALYEQSVVEQLVADQFEQYVERVKKTDCQAELRRLLEKGPPIYVEDKHAFPLDEGDTHVVQLWFASDDTERPAKLKGALEGEERDTLWNELRKFIIVEGKEQGDDEDGADNGTL